MSPLEPAVQTRGQEPLTASMLASAPPMDQKQLLGAYGRAIPSCLIRTGVQLMLIFNRLKASVCTR